MLRNRTSSVSALQVQNAALHDVIDSLQRELIQLQQTSCAGDARIETVRDRVHRPKSGGGACETTDTDDLASASVSPESSLPCTGPRDSLTAPTELGECGICLGRICQAAIGSCTHHFCFACLLQASASRQACPKCRCRTKNLRPDPEFDALLCAAGLQPTEAEEEVHRRAIARFTLLLQLPAGTHPGISVKRWKHGPGILVTEVREKDQAYRCGLRKDDCIVAMNGTAVTSSESFVSHIDGLSKTPNGEALTLHVIPASLRPPAEDTTSFL